MKYISIIIGLLFLSACSTQEGTEQKPQAVEEKAQEEVQEISKTVELEIVQEGEKVILTLLNPEESTILSTRTWLAFPPNTLTISDLNLNATIFDLAAPDEYKVDKENGIIKIGLATTQAINSSRILLGSFSAENTTENPVPLSCYDYSEDTNSHCTVIGEKQKNILKPVNTILIP